MDKNRQKDYARRIAQANKTELVVITYDIILEELAGSKSALQKGDIENYRSLVKSALKFLAELMSALDYRYSPSRQLMSLYIYVQKTLIACDVSGSDKGIESAENVLRGLRKSFHEITGLDTSGPVMANSQSVYAGLTYGKGTLTEMNLSDGENRGFLA